MIHNASRRCLRVAYSHHRSERIGRGARPPGPVEATTKPGRGSTAGAHIEHTVGIHRGPIAQARRAADPIDPVVRLIWDYCERPRRRDHERPPRRRATSSIDRHHLGDEDGRVGRRRVRRPRLAPAPPGHDQPGEIPGPARARVRVTMHPRARPRPASRPHPQTLSPAPDDGPVLRSRGGPKHAVSKP